MSYIWSAAFCLDHGNRTRVFTDVMDAQSLHVARHATTQKHIDAANDGVKGALALRLFALVLKAFLGGKIGSSKAASGECDVGVPGVGGRHKVR